jgi:hypothetical protein
MDLCGSAAEFDLHTSLHQVCNKLLVWVPSGNVTVRVERLVVQRHVAGICVKDRYNLGLGVPVGDVVRDELKVKKTRRQIAFER